VAAYAAATSRSDVSNRSSRQRTSWASSGPDWLLNLRAAHVCIWSHAGLHSASEQHDYRMGGRQEHFVRLPCARHSASSRGRGVGVDRPKVLRIAAALSLASMFREVAIAALVYFLNCCHTELLQALPSLCASVVADQKCAIISVTSKITPWIVQLQ
jgi:hypothetical protein